MRYPYERHNLRIVCAPSCLSIAHTEFLLWQRLESLVDSAPCYSGWSRRDSRSYGTEGMVRT
jgi:hypothetical protein